MIVCVGGEKSMRGCSGATSPLATLLFNIQAMLHLDRFEFTKSGIVGKKPIFRFREVRNHPSRIFTLVTSMLKCNKRTL